MVKDGSMLMPPSMAGVMLRGQWVCCSEKAFFLFFSPMAHLKKSRLTDFFFVSLSLVIL